MLQLQGAVLAVAAALRDEILYTGLTERTNTRRHRIVPGRCGRICAFLYIGLLCRTKGGKLGTDKTPEKEKRHGIHKG